MIRNENFCIRKNGKPYSNCYCRTPELIENYQEAVNDPNEIWICHHRLEKCFSQKFMVRMSLYYNCEPDALIFIRKSEHNGNPNLHIEVRKRRGCNLSEEHKRKIGESNKGKKHKLHTEETKRKMSEAAKNRKDNYYCGNAGRGKTWKVINGKRVWLDKESI